MLVLARRTSPSEFGAFLALYGVTIALGGIIDFGSSSRLTIDLAKGLDTRKVKYVVISHAHADHDGGAKFLQDTIPSAHLVYGGPDWDAIDRSPNHAGGKPKRDTSGADGMRLSVGDASVQIVTTPGHTPGTLSFLFEAKDNGKPLRIAYVGGTAIPFNGDAAYYDGYIASVKKMAKAAADFGATALLSNHTEFDNAFYKAHTAANRKRVRLGVQCAAQSRHCETGRISRQSGVAENPSNPRTPEIFLGL